MFCGYLNDSERTNEALDDEGWFYSGDLCTIDEEERVRINGRKKEIIIRGGENISAREVDDNVMDWEDICDQATVGMPDDRAGRAHLPFRRARPRRYRGTLLARPYGVPCKQGRG